MKNTYQFKNIDMLKHGEMVHDEYIKIMNAIKSNSVDELKNMCIDLSMEDLHQLYNNQYNIDIMSNYHIYHDCGKHISKCIDENGKVHYPDHAKHSSNLYFEYFDNEMVKDLIFKDMNFHNLKNEELMNWITIENKVTVCSLYLSAWAELLANSELFGGKDCDSFKIKRKKLLKSFNKIKSIF